jgi:mxaJ protein
MTARCTALAGMMVLLLSAAALPAAAQDKAPERKALRVCQDPNNLPFSNTKGEGIENRIAEVFGKALGLPVTYYSFPQRLAFIRNTLRYKLPGADYPATSS